MLDDHGLLRWIVAAVWAVWAVSVPVTAVSPAATTTAAAITHMLSRVAGLIIPSTVGWRRRLQIVLFLAPHVSCRYFAAVITAVVSSHARRTLCRPSGGDLDVVKVERQY